MKNEFVIPSIIEAIIMKINSTPNRIQYNLKVTLFEFFCFDN